MIEISQNMTEKNKMQSNNCFYVATPQIQIYFIRFNLRREIARVKSGVCLVQTIGSSFAWNIRKLVADCHPAGLHPHALQAEGLGAHVGFAITSSGLSWRCVWWASRGYE